MVISLAFALAIIAALVTMARRRQHRAALRRAAKERLGGSPERAIHVRGFDEMDDHVAGRWCVCGGYLERTGEGSRDIGGRRFRIVRLQCQECEERDEVFFDTTDVVH